MEELGLDKVTTFRQSGNVIFDAGNAQQQRLKTRIETALHRNLGYEVAVFIRTLDDLARIVDSASSYPDEKGTSLLVTLLSSSFAKFPLALPATIPKSTAQIVSASGAEVYSLTHGGGEGALPNPFLESKLKAKSTTRNINVIREIVERYR